jgi:hypothetical protein
MKGLLINPLAKEIIEVESDGSLEDMYRQLECNMVETIELDNGDTAWVDESGWIEYKDRGGVCYPSVTRGHFFELAGPVLILGTNLATGEPKNCKMTLKEAQEAFKFIPEQRLNELIHYYA